MIDLCLHLGIGFCFEKLKLDQYYQIIKKQSVKVNFKLTTRATLNEVRRINEIFRRLWDYFAISKIYKIFLSERLAKMESQSWANTHYSRNDILELVGIFRKIKDVTLEEQFRKIVEKAEVNIERKLETYNCLIFAQQGLHASVRA